MSVSESENNSEYSAFAESEETDEQSDWGQDDPDNILVDIPHKNTTITWLVNELKYAEIKKGFHESERNSEYRLAPCPEGHRVEADSESVPENNCCAKKQANNFKLFADDYMRYHYPVPANYTDWDTWDDSDEYHYNSD